MEHHFQITGKNDPYGGVDTFSVYFRYYDGTMITKRQKQVLDFVKQHGDREGYAPSLVEIKKHFKLSSESTVHQHLTALAEKGYLTKEKHQPRGIMVVADPKAKLADDINVVESTSKQANLGSPGKRKLVNKLNDLSAAEWIPETISVYVQRGLGTGHQDTKIEKQHPAPYSFQDVSRLIRFFTKKNDLVLDPFCGVGSTLKACALNGRRGLGIELVRKYADLTKLRLAVELVADDATQINKDQKIVLGDSLKEVTKLENDSIDFIVTSPPYWNILKKADHKVQQERVSQNLDTKYSNLKKDLGNIDDYQEFLDVLSGFFNDCSRVLKPQKYICIVISDFRNKDKYYMFHSDLAQKLEQGNFMLKGITVLYQRHKKIFPYGYPYSYVPNIHHQYILILQNKKVPSAEYAKK